MKVQVKLFGTLGREVSNYNHDQGLTIAIDEDADVKDLVGLLPLSKPKEIIVSVGGRVVKADHKLKNEDVVYVFQSVHGG